MRGEKRHRGRPAVLLGIVAIGAIILAGASPAFAHPGSHHDVERLTAELARSPDRLDLLYLRARALRLDGRPEASLRDLDRAGQLDPESRVVWLERALSLSDLRRDAEAEKELTRCLEKEPANIAALVARGHIRQRTGKPAEAILDFSLSLQWKPDPEIYLARGRLQESLHQLDEAARGYREGLLRLPGAIVLQKQLIQIELARKDYPAAVAIIEEQLQKPGNKADLLLLRAGVRAAASDEAGARDDRRRALQEANRALQRRLTAINLFNRARVYWAMGRPADAEADLDAASARSPGYEPIARLRQEIRTKASIVESPHDAN